MASKTVLSWKNTSWQYKKKFILSLKMEKGNENFILKCVKKGIEGFFTLETEPHFGQRGLNLTTDLNQIEIEMGKL